jgi:hypothetical protein
MPAPAVETARPDLQFSNLEEDPLERLRERLIEMRAGLVRRLAIRIEGGDLALLGSCPGRACRGRGELAARGCQ